jgi:mRNA-degrading endonuclease YafQ of YafQ-DinJ toxin-antitoxin module
MNNAIPSVDSTSVTEFQKDLKRLAKFRHIESDLEVAVKVIQAEPLNAARCYRAEGLGEDCSTPVYVLKKFRSTDLRSTNELRLVYGFSSSKNKIVLTEIYFKGDNEVEDKARIRKYFADGSDFKIEM